MMIAETNQGTTPTGEYLIRGAACIIVLACEWIATIILRVAKPYVDYQLAAILLAVLLAISIPLLGKRAVIRDLCEICWLDVGIQIVGAIIAQNNGRLFWYGAFANAIFFMKWARIFWSERNHDGSWAGWPIFGLIGLVQRKQYPNPLTSLQTASAYFVMLLCLGAGYVHQVWTIKAGLLAPLCVIVTIVLLYARTLIANVEAQQAELLAATAELAVKAAELEEKNGALEKLNHEVTIANEDLSITHARLTRHTQLVDQANHDIAPLLSFLHTYIEYLGNTALDEQQRDYLSKIISIVTTTADHLARNIGTRRHPAWETKSGFVA
ncbi:MAG: hypothetical protein RL748_74, partial [Pseudomonadota bacterium]